MKIIIKIYVISILLMASFAYPQNKPEQVIQSIQNGINAGDVSQFTKLLKQKIYVSLLNGHSDYYSPNQAHYVIQDFFNYYEPIKFEFGNLNTEDSYTFATGELIYYHKGLKKKCRVFVALKLIDKEWQISQLTIN